MSLATPLKKGLTRSSGALIPCVPRAEYRTMVTTPESI